MKKTILFLAVVYCTYSCKNEKGEPVKMQTYTVSGEVKGINNGEVYIQVLNKAKPKIDTLKIENSKFTYKGEAASPELAELQIKNINARTIFFTDLNSKINIVFDSAAKEKFVVTGSKANDEFIAFKKKSIAPIEEKARKTFENINPMSIANQQTMDSLKKLAEAIQQEEKDAVVNYIAANNTSYIGAAYAYLLGTQEQDTKFIQAAYNAMGNNTKNSFYGTEIKRKIDAESKTETGATATDFTCNNVDGKPLKLSDFYKGKKLVLIDFWASWCGPCRKENPNVVKAYNKYHAKGFDILGVSLDEEKADWIEAINKDKLSWTHVSDLKSWESNVAHLYNITAIPTNFLIDGNGKIIAMNLRGEELENKLKELLK